MKSKYFERYNQSVLPVLLCLVVAVLGAGCPGEIGPAGPEGPEGPEGPAGPGAALAPGLNITIESVTIPADLRPEIVFSALDDAGNEIGLTEFSDIRFMLAYLEGSGTTPANNELSPRLVSYTFSSRSGKPSYDSDGRFRGMDDPGGATQNTDGTISYKYGAALPADYDVAATHQLAGQMARTYVIDGESYRVNDIHRFVPNGSAVLATREIVDTETCNACHTRLAIHGSRREIQYCIMCHNDQMTDPADATNSAEMQNMIHKIHMGADMPILGYFEGDFDEVVYPQDIRNCESCHQNAPQADVWKELPSRAACGSCHNDVWFGDPTATPAEMENHPFDFEQMNDSQCAICHTPANIDDDHKTDVEQDEAPGLALDILSVTTDPVADSDPAEVTVTIVISAVDGLGAPYTDLTTFQRLRGRIAYPAPDYQEYFYEDLLLVDAMDNHDDGTYTYTFIQTLLADSEDTFAVGLEGRVGFMLDGEEERQGTSSNGLTFFTLDGSDPVERRIIVSNEKCNVCHDEIRFHGDSRFGVDYCVMCHNPNKSGSYDKIEIIDGEEVEVEVPVTVNFKDMIHSIHTGHELDNEYKVGSHDYNILRFPGDTSQCAICHIDDNPSTRGDDEATFDLPLPAEVLATVVEEEVDEDVYEHVWTKAPTRAACVSCHDSVWTDIHAILETTTEGDEACVVCHGEGSDYDVEAVHEMGP